jgi:ATP-dependent Lhr-like helicase
MNISQSATLDWAHPLVKEWFLEKFGSPTEPQEQGWGPILAGKTTLISAPTGSGKTFAAFLVCINNLIAHAAKGTLKDETQVLYISPLKALGNDIQKNLLGPLAEITALAKKKSQPLLPIRVSVRTGDTPQKERQAMLKNPPHILITTPESFYILLTADKSRTMLQTVKTVIVDEIHAIANDKRGSHLALSLERLEALTLKRPNRIGLSATQKPLELVAQFLSGVRRVKPVIINIGHARHLSLSIEVPQLELGAVASNEMWDEIYDKITEFSQSHRSTLVFVNTRKLAERVAHHLSERIGEGLVAAHHGSLSRKLRLEAETNLKEGKLKVLVATASLELGIDIGTIDLVCQIGSPRSIAAGLQRVGRAGHWHGAISKGCFFATTRDELVECAALIYAIKEGDLDRLIIPKEPIDILAQQIVATCATGEWFEEALFKLVKKAFPYKDLSRTSFNDVLEILSEGIAGSRGRYGAYLFRDKVNHIVKARRKSRLVAITSGGAIPENGLFTMIAQPEGVVVGTLDEDFAVESNRGDVILLGTTSWIIQRIDSKAGKVFVEDAHGAPPSVPFWRGEAPARTDELSLQVSQLRQRISERIPGDLSLDQISSHPQTSVNLAWLHSNCGVDQRAGLQLLKYITEGRIVLGQVPTQQTVIAERFFDESGGMQLIIHAPFGARINKAWGLALRKRFCRSFNFELQAAATDNGLNIALAEQHSFPLADVFHFLHPNTLKEVLVQAILQSPLFKTRWRWVATRSLSLVRFRNGKKVPPNIQRMLSDDLLAAVFPDAAACQDNLAGEDVKLVPHPLIDETMKDATTEALDLEGLTHLIENILANTIQCVAIDTPLPSVFSHEILNANPYAFLDDAPLEERRARAVQMRRILPDSVLQEVGRLDPQAIMEVKKQAWPDIRDKDELHDLLQTLIAFPEDKCSDPHWRDYLAPLIAQKRAAIVTYNHKQFWLAAEKTTAFAAIYPEALIPPVAPVEQKEFTPEAALQEMLRHWLIYLGPVTELELCQLLSLEANAVHQTLLALENTGLILRAHEIGWCERRLLARIHRLTIDKLRKEIEPVTPEQFMHWLLKWQHVAPSTQVRGEQGLLEIINQLQGFEIPANAWESQIFAKRMQIYLPELLDRLCLGGAIGWGRLSQPLKPDNEDATPKKNTIPRSIAPITFFVREFSDWMPERQVFSDPDSMHGVSAGAKTIYFYLKEHGASFFADIIRGSGKLQSQVESGLWELTSLGLVTADGFDSLRAIIDPKRRNDKRRRKMHFHYGAGRWSILSNKNAADPQIQLEAACWMLLKRYGVVFRELLAREKNIPRWRELLIIFRRLEDRGEIRGGRFVNGFYGEQFALPYAVDSLRATRKQEPIAIASMVHAADPLNLVGIILPGARISSGSSKCVNINGSTAPGKSHAQKTQK